MPSRTNLQRREVLAAFAKITSAGFLLGAGACSRPPGVYSMTVSRDAGCQCCHVWAELMEATGRFRISLKNGANLPALKQTLGVPTGFASCHTAEVDTCVIEGHVPAEDILRLIEERPAGVRGLAVPGMPRGSPGMEQPDGSVDRYEVIAFTAEGETSVFAVHGTDA